MFLDILVVYDKFKTLRTEYLFLNTVNAVHFIYKVYVNNIVFEF
jgi:hypothetical protein